MPFGFAHCEEQVEKYSDPNQPHPFPSPASWARDNYLSLVLVNCTSLQR